MVGTEYVKPDVILDNLGHQSIDGAPAGGDHLQDDKAFRFLFKRFLYCIDLASDPSYPVEKFLFFPCGMAQSLPPD
jgi:hypothetical protein